MRAVVKDLRPHIIEVLRSPDFQNCKAADEIRKNLKVLMDLYKQMTAETVSIGKCKIVPEVHSTSNENKDGDAKPGPEDGWAHGTYVVGGSAFGWNFITFPGGKATYYGVTKGTFRATAQ